MVVIEREKFSEHPRPIIWHIKQLRSIYRAKWSKFFGLSIFWHFCNFRILLKSTYLPGGKRYFDDFYIKNDQLSEILRLVLFSSDFENILGVVFEKIDFQKKSWNFTKNLQVRGIYILVTRKHHFCNPCVMCYDRFRGSFDHLSWFSRYIPPKIVPDNFVQIENMVFRGYDPRNVFKIFWK